MKSDFNELGAQEACLRETPEWCPMGVRTGWGSLEVPGVGPVSELKGWLGGMRAQREEDFMAT